MEGLLGQDKNRMLSLLLSYSKNGGNIKTYRPLVDCNSPLVTKLKSNLNPPSPGVSPPGHYRPG